MFEKVTYTFSVDGIKCEKCSNRIKDNLKNIKGVKNIEVSIESKIVTVTCAKKVEAETIKKAIDTLGFVVIESK